MVDNDCKFKMLVDTRSWHPIGFSIDSRGVLLAGAWLLEEVDLVAKIAGVIYDCAQGDMHPQFTSSCRQFLGAVPSSGLELLRGLNSSLSR